MATPEEQNKFLVANPKEMEINELCNKQFKIIISWKLKELQKNIDNSMT